MAKPSRNKLPLVLVLIATAAATRLLPHPPNFVPVGAMALFGAAALPLKRLAVIVPLLAFYLSDLALNNLVYAQYFESFYWGADPFIYGGLVLMVLFGMGALRGKSFNWLRIGGAALGATVIFFLLSNFGVWSSGTMYPKTATGLLLAFTAGLPFLVNSLLANLLFTGVFFGLGQFAGVFGPAEVGDPAYDTLP